MRYPWIHEIEDAENDTPLSECAFCPEPIGIKDEMVWWYTGMGEGTLQAHRACYRTHALAG